MRKKRENNKKFKRKMILEIRIFFKESQFGQQVQQEEPNRLAFILAPLSSSQPWTQG